MNLKGRSPLSVVLALAGLAHGAASVRAAPGLDPADRFQQEIVVGSHQTTVALFRDHALPARFYYVPLQPRLEETTRKIEGRDTTLPVFHLTIYQVQKRNEKVYEGGYLQFAATLALP